MSQNLQIVRPQVEVEKALDVFSSFNELCERVLNEEDYHIIKGNRYLNKRAWNKLGMIFNLTKQILDSEFIEFDSGVKGVRYRVRALAPNGRYCDAEGVVTSNERWSKGKNLSAMMAFAQTRAFNRAVASLIAPDQVSYEEMTEVESTSTPRPNYSRFVKSIGDSLPQAKLYIKKTYGCNLSDATQEMLNETLSHFTNEEEILKVI